MKTFRLGRAEDNDVVFQHDQSVSAYHLIIRQDERGQWVVEDLQSTNGTFVNQKRIIAGKPMALQPGDALRIGKTLVPWHQYVGVELPTSSLQKTQWLPPSNAATLGGISPQTSNKGMEALSWVFIGLVFFTILLLALAYWK